jgi:trans-aconitate methyltransferase
MGWNAEKYNEIQSKHQFVYGNQLIKRLSDFCNLSSYKILDLGCDEGTLTQILADYVEESGSVIGVDSDSDMIKRAIAKTHNFNIIFIESDVIDWLFTFEGKINVVFSNAMLHWLKSYEKLDLFFSLCKSKMFKGGYGAFHFSLNDNAKESKKFLQINLREYLQDDSISVGSSEYEYDAVSSMIEKYFTVVYKNSIQSLPFSDDENLNFDWMIKSQPIQKYFKSKAELNEFILFFRKKWDSTPIKVTSSRCEFIFKS